MVQSYSFVKNVGYTEYTTVNNNLSWLKSKKKSNEHKCGYIYYYFILFYLHNRLKIKII